ncbi:MAG: DUF3073 domain-containing protein [Nocardioidaceae bacterium]
MGRGRAKAKQTKVARELKYRPQGTDLSQLQRELHGDSPAAHLSDDITGADPDRAVDDEFADSDYDEPEASAR